MSDHGTLREEDDEMRERESERKGSGERFWNGKRESEVKVRGYNWEREIEREGEREYIKILKYKVTVIV